jgi:hypothetical protein
VTPWPTPSLRATSGWVICADLRIIARFIVYLPSVGVSVSD